MTETAEKSTSLGVPFKRISDIKYQINLSELKSFTGLSVIARMLGDDILEQIKLKNTDTVVRRRIIKEITPQLVDLGINRIIIYSRSNVLKKLPEFSEEFHDQIRTVFGSLQRPRWGGQLFPEYFTGKQKKLEQVPALLFPFHLHFEKEDIDYYFLVERNIEEGFIRISIEPEVESRLNLSCINHVVVDDLDRRNYLQGLSRFVESIYHGILRENENFKSEYTEVDKRHDVFFRQIQQGGIPNLNSISFFWKPEDAEDLIHSMDLPVFLKKILLVLEDRDISKILNNGKILEVAIGEASATLDVSRLGRSLNVSLISRREIPLMDFYLDRMPSLKNLSMKESGSLSGYTVFLIHHITSEILGTIKALEVMGCDHLQALFVKYAGIVPADYLEVLLSQDESFFKSYGLHRVDSQDTIEGYYVLSQQYSQLKRLESLSRILSERKLGFFEAMKISAMHLFLLEAAKVKLEGKKILLVEDGGYLAPELNRLAKENSAMESVLKEYGITGEAEKIFGVKNDLLFKDWIQPILPGTVEHTRNGYDRMMSVQNEFGSLHFPAVTIALSSLKVERESKEVSVSILHALESILHGLGFVLTERTPMILGSSGAIGKNLMSDLNYRLASKIIGVDLIARNLPEERFYETDSYDSIPDELFLKIDLIIGVVGKSILKKDFFEKLILEGEKQSIFILSGSTKTVEFTDLTDWLKDLNKLKKPEIGNHGVKFETGFVRDPQTSMILGNKVVIHFNGKQKNLYLLGGLTPLNFLYYGVPTETMDNVLMQLLSLAAGIVRRFKENRSLSNLMHALDHQIDVNCEDLK
ncbi:MAG: hypothetical protein OEZ34_00540 [Spirochaetia bacterium]|nr:hypothetical protein [Spirochaetia bacterium]